MTKLRLKLVASLLIVFHLCAVALPPLSLQTQGIDGPSPLVGLLIRPFEGYGQFLHIDRGYAFFAPDPGPSHLIQAATIDADGSVSEQMIPDLDRQWPRLLYHRHFMLAEFLNEAYIPPGPPDEMFQSDPRAAALWEQRRGRYEWIRQSMTEHLQTTSDGAPVAIRRLEHGLPNLADFQAQPIELNDPRLYSLLLDQPIYSDQIAPAPETEVIPAPGQAGKASGDGQIPVTSDQESGR